MALGVRNVSVTFEKRAPDGPLGSYADFTHTMSIAIAAKL